MRIKWIDNAKGIAILLVIIGHTCYQLDDYWNFHFVFGIHLVMFFLLSGFTLKKNLTRDYINNKFRRLLVPYFYTCVAVTIMDIVNSWVWEHDLSIKCVTDIISTDITRSFFASGTFTQFGSIEIGSRIGAIWFLPAMFFGLLFFQLILHFTDSSIMRGSIAAGTSLIAYITAKFIWLPFSIQSGMFAVFFIWLGYEIKERNLLGKVSFIYYAAAQIALLIGIRFGWCDISFARADMADVLLSIPVGLSGCLLIYLLSVLDVRGHLLSYLGRTSLLILCVHLVTINTFTRYIDRFLDICQLSGQFRGWLFIALNILIACIGAFIIDKRNALTLPAIPRNKNKVGDTVSLVGNRDVAIDVQKGVLIVLMLVGHFSIDKQLSMIIYSCHMEAFVVLSGYFYKSGRPIGKTFNRMAHTFLVPYCIAAVLIVVCNPSLWDNHSITSLFFKYLAGISFTDKIFTSFESVGPIYFILLLFVTRIIYTILDHIIKNDGLLTIAVVLISLGGVYLGLQGYWLPWSLDIACYSLVFYHIGTAIRNNNIFAIIRNNGSSYFVLSSVWAYMIYKGSMEIAVRNYGKYGLTIIGATAGTLLLYSLSSYISAKTCVATAVLSKLGQCSIVIIIVHTALRPLINSILMCHFDSEYLPFMALSIISQLLIAVLAKIIIDYAQGFLNDLMEP